MSAEAYLLNRVRENTDLTIRDHISITYGSGNPYVPAGEYPVIPLVSSYFTHYDLMVDNGWSKVKHGKFPNSPCKQLSILIDAEEVHPFNGNYGALITPHGWQFPCEITWITDMVPEVQESIWQDCAEVAFTTFSTQFPETVSVGNFLWELRELGQLIPELASNIAKTVANGYLTQKFGWEPFLRDLWKLAQVNQVVLRRLEYLRKTWGHWTRLGYFRGNARELSPASFEHYYMQGYGVRIDLKSYRCDFRAGGRLFHQLDHLNDTIGLLRAFASAVGLNNPVKAVWQALPFSFVLDWFTKVSQHFARLTVLNDASRPWYVTDQSCSMKEEAWFDLWQVNDGISYYTASPPRSLGRARMRRYTRRVGLPLSWEVYKPSMLNPSQLTLFLAMLAGASR